MTDADFAGFTQGQGPGSGNGPPDAGVDSRIADLEAKLTARQLDSVFEKFAIKEINPVGEKFDPHRHQAISQVESAEEPNTVVSVLQKGYLLHDRVLRPALVVVAKAKEEAA